MGRLYISLVASCLDASSSWQGPDVLFLLFLHCCIWEATTLQSGVHGVMWVGTWLLFVCKDPWFWGLPTGGHYSSLKRRLRTMWSALSPWPCSPFQLLSNSELFSPCGWRARGRVCRCKACQRAQPGRPRKGGQSRAVLFGRGRMREIEPWNVGTGQWLELA